MTSNHDRRFIEIAERTILGFASPAEQAELDSLLTANPQYLDEYKRLKEETPRLREALILLKEAESTGQEIPHWRQARVQEKVNKTFCNDNEREPWWKRWWRFLVWTVSIPIATAALVLLVQYIPYWTTSRTAQHSPSPPPPLVHVVSKGELDITRFGPYRAKCDVIIRNDGGAGWLTVTCRFTQEANRWVDRGVWYKSETRYFGAGQDQTITFMCEEVNRWGGDIRAEIIH